MTGNGRLRLPHDGPGDDRVAWSLEDDRVVARMDASLLTKNFQTTSACAPAYAWCFAWWIRAGGCRVKVRCSPTDPPPADSRSPRWLDWNRSALLLAEYERLLGDRFQLDLPRGAWAWPTDPVLNAARGARSKEPGNDKAEHVLEVGLVADPTFRTVFSEVVEPVEPLQRQLPVGLFEGRVSADRYWTPGKGSQVDLWTRSEDRRTVHLFELKAPGNAPLGMIQEALGYGRIVQEVVRGRIRGADVAHLAEAEQVVVWLLATDVHSLLGRACETPLAWLRQGLRGTGLDIRFAPAVLTELLT